MSKTTPTHILAGPTQAPQKLTEAFTSPITTMDAINGSTTPRLRSSITATAPYKSQKQRVSNPRPAISLPLTHQPNRTVRILTRSPLCHNPKPVGTGPNPAASSCSSENEETATNVTGSLGGRDSVVRLGEALSLGLPLCLGSACLLALRRPSTFLWVGRDFQILGLTVTMLGIYLLIFV